MGFVEQSCNGLGRCHEVRGGRGAVTTDVSYDIFAIPDARCVSIPVLWCGVRSINGVARSNNICVIHRICTMRLLVYLYGVQIGFIY